jgi:hypothetical protein
MTHDVAYVATSGRWENRCWSAKMDVSELIIQFNGILHDLNLHGWVPIDRGLQINFKIARVCVSCSKTRGA